MYNSLLKFKNFEINKEELKKICGNDLYNVDIKKEMSISTNDVINAIKFFRAKKITIEQLVDWVNVVWFTDMFKYKDREENSIASVLSLLETMDEDNVSFTENDFNKMIISLKNNEECLL